MYKFLLLLEGVSVVHSRCGIVGVMYDRVWLQERNAFCMRKGVLAHMGIHRVPNTVQVYFTTVYFSRACICKFGQHGHREACGSSIYGVQRSGCGELIVERGGFDRRLFG